jgi:hypothetical protein
MTLGFTVWIKSQPHAFKKLEDLKVSMNISNTLIRLLLQHFEDVFKVSMTEDIRRSLRLLLWDTRSFFDLETKGVNVLPKLQPAYGTDGRTLSEDPAEEHIAAYATTHLKMIFASSEATDKQEGKDGRQDSGVGLQEDSGSDMGDSAAKIHETDVDEAKSEASDNKQEAKSKGESHIGGC